MKHIYLKESTGDREAFTALTKLLESENISRDEYQRIRLRLLQGKDVEYNQIRILKVKFNHYKANGKSN